MLHVNDTQRRVVESSGINAHLQDNADEKVSPQRRLAAQSAMAAQAAQIS